MVFNDVDGIYTYAYEAEKKEDCLVCSQKPQILEIKDPQKIKLKNLIEILSESPAYQMKNPGLTTVIDGKNKTLYIGTIKSIEERTRINLDKSLIELGIEDGQELLVADVTSPTTLVIVLKFLMDDVEMKSAEFQ